MEKQWVYYNHALVPTVAPHEEPDASWMKDPSKWKELSEGHYPLFARWTTDFDCAEETEWWYIVRDSPISLDQLSRSSRHSIRRALKKCEVKQIDPQEYLDEMWRVYREAFTRYRDADNEMDEAAFRDCYSNNRTADYWGGFSVEDDLRMIGYLVCERHSDWVELSVSKYSTDFLRLRVSDALCYTALDYYLNEEKLRYVSNGQRSVNHVTNVQEYSEDRFGYRKAYCHLHIKYRPLFGAAVAVLYPFRGILKKLNSGGMMHSILSVLDQEEIRRTFPES